MNWEKLAKERGEEVICLKHDIEVYRGVLGYSINDRAGNVDSLTDGTRPKCGLCNSEYTKTAKEFYEKWLSDSSLEKWFPFSAEELAKLKSLNEDKFKTIEAYCKAASDDRWRIKRLSEAIYEYLHTPGFGIDGYGTTSDILSKALEETKLPA